ncbi:hypothetical protein ACHQM5_001997 [Ranunculus cassubicifolius]
MEANPYNERFAFPGVNDDAKALNEHDWMMVDQKPDIGGHIAPNSDFIFGSDGLADLKVGFLYEIDHRRLPRESPLHIEGIRAVMITEVTEVIVTVRSPSTLSLRSYFSGNNSQRKYPELDRQFTMGSKLAKAILIRQIPPDEFMKQRHLQIFWLLPFKIPKTPPATTNRDLNNEALTKGVCWLSLNSLVGWGGQRKATFLRKEKMPLPPGPSMSTVIKKEVDSETDTKPTEEQKARVLKRKPNDAQTEIKPNEEAKPKRKKREYEGSLVKVVPKTEIRHRNRKRKRGIQKQDKKSKAVKLAVKKPCTDIIVKPTSKYSYGWWSQDRYKNAEVKMFAIMRAKGAVLGNPILRQALRLEARKHIGDTGLLDHVLKHMADKVSPNGIDRFRRRHNAEGAMEYWLEHADLFKVRREAGVKDPYWIPPPGWKPGDNPSQDPNWARELKSLKEEIISIKKDVQELQLLKREDEVDKAIVISTKSPSDSCDLQLGRVVSLQEEYESLTKRKVQLEQQLTLIRKRNLEERKRSEETEDIKGERMKPSSKTREQKMTLSYGRWSTDRYKNAEVKMMEVMKAKGAVVGKPMLRQDLRLEVRKHIGDTGLLDHILKHMADKVAPNGVDRFRRRHNHDGAMEYWLESADLVDIRREAGVRDPFWIPPLGWKPGDNPSQDHNYARELQLLREEMSIIEKDVQELLQPKREEGDKAIVVSAKSSSESCSLESDTTVVSFQEDYDDLAKRNAPLEQDDFEEAFNGMQFLQDSIFHLSSQHDSMNTNGIHLSEQDPISAFLAGPHGSLNNFFRCDFMSSQPLDTEYLLV